MPRKPSPGDLHGAAPLTAQLLRLADRAAARLRAHQLAAGTVSVKIRRADFTTYTRQTGAGTRRRRIPAVVSRSCEDPARAMAGKLQPTAAVRLLGVGVSDLQTSAQGDLFGLSSASVAAGPAIDGIRERFGPGMLTRASLLTRFTNG